MNNSPLIVLHTSNDDYANNLQDGDFDGTKLMDNLREQYSI